MTTWVWKAIDLRGVPTRGEVEAPSKDSVVDQLKQRELIVLDVAAKKGSIEIDLDRFKPIKARDLTIMSRQLATMVSSGMTLLHALSTLEAQTKNPVLRKSITAVRLDVESGSSLSEAMSRQPKAFNTLFVAMVAAGETGGILEESLQRVADQLEKDDALRRQVKTALVYPSGVLGFAFIVLTALIVFLVPVFENIYTSLGDAELPAMTRFTVGLSNSISGLWFVWIGGFVVAFIAFQRWRKHPKGRRQWDLLRMKVPVKIGDTVQKVALARWSRTFSSLIASGVPILEAIDITGRTAGNTRIEDAMDGVKESVRRGGTISGPLKAESFLFPTMVTNMVAVGEDTGALDTMLAKVADFYEDEVAAAVKALTSILEPIMIAVVGSVVGFIVITMYLPLFDVYNQIQ